MAIDICEIPTTCETVGCGRTFVDDPHRPGRRRRFCAYCRPPVGNIISNNVPSMECAGDCGKFLYRGPGSLPEGQAKCRECREVDRLDRWNNRPRPRRIIGPKLPCPVCGETFQPMRNRKSPTGKTRFCSARCATLFHNGIPWTPPGANKRALNISHNAKRRSKVQSQFIEHVDPDTVYARDDWLCHICGNEVFLDVGQYDPIAATLDHVIPLSQGGEHSYANIRTAHRFCNTSKGARVG